MRANATLARWRNGEQTIGCWLSMANAYSAEAMGRMGFDWACIDLQHGLIDYQDLTYMLPALSTSETTPLVRVPWNEPYEIMKVLDAGAYGVIVPMVNNREEALRAVAACRYPPDGNRSFGPIRAAMYGGRGYAAQANGQMACIAMIETAQGLENLEEVASTPGVDGLYIGPSDLALALGLPPTGDNDHPKHAEQVQRILDVCRKYKIAAGIHTSSLEYTRKYLKAGFNMVMLGTDSAFMMQAAGSQLAAARGTAQEKREKTGY
ncbi:MAG: aldolase/citrate lyase family protein [Proteobacteria bacterium]|nr:aldolase/citrate lyase family protein [Pseudomonadota bacterium]